METVTEGVRPSRRGVTPPSRPEGSTGFLSDVIVELGYVDRATADWAVEQGRVMGQAVPAVLLDSGILTADQLSRAIGELHGFDHVDLDAFDVDLDVARLISRSAARRYQAVPIAFDDDGTLLVALSDPVDPLAVDDIAVMTKSEVHPMVATQGTIEAVIEKLHDAPARPAQLEEPRDEPLSGRPFEEPAGAAAAPRAPMPGPAPEGPQAPPDRPAPSGNGDEMAQMRQALADLAARVESFTAPPAEPADAAVPPPEAHEPAEEPHEPAVPSVPLGEHEGVIERLEQAERRAREAESALDELRTERDRERELHARTQEELRAQLESAKEASSRFEQRLSSVMEATAEIRAACERLIGADGPRR